MTLAFVGASRARAAAITIDTYAGTTYTTAGINDFSANASQMNGMEITARWTVNGASHAQTQVWNKGVNFTGYNFDLAVSGDTFDTNAWQLDFNMAGDGLLQAIEFNGVPGNTVFDRSFNGFAGTPGSSLGKDFSGFDGYAKCFLVFFCAPGEIKATYFNQVAVGTDRAVGDLFAGLKLEFNSFGGLGEGNDWRFSLDTDIATAPLVIPTAPATAVPEPASMLLFGSGLFTLAGAARRRMSRRS
jgi:hypothetical protein